MGFKWGFKGLKKIICTFWIRGSYCLTTLLFGQQRFILTTFKKNRRGLDRAFPLWIRNKLNVINTKNSKWIVVTFVSLVWVSLWTGCSTKCTFMANAWRRYPRCMEKLSPYIQLSKDLSVSSFSNGEKWRLCGRPKIKLFNPLNPELKPICYLLALLGTHHFLHVSRIMVKLLTFRRLMSYIYILYGAPILDVSRSHTTTQHSR